MYDTDEFHRSFAGASKRGSSEFGQFLRPLKRLQNWRVVAVKDVSGALQKTAEVLLAMRIILARVRFRPVVSTESRVIQNA